jgi:uncharacterized protein YndB with AHSA1/START domain
MMTVGKTKTQGWEIGVRRTFPITTERAWTLLMTQPGLGIWFGNGVDTNFEKGDRFTTDEDTTGEIRSYNRGSLIRMRWQPRGWEAPSTLQVRVLEAKTGATISFHHEKLIDGDQRAAMHKHWSEVMDKLGALIKE